MAIEQLKEKLQESLQAVGEKLKDPVSIIRDMKEASTDKLITLTNDVLGLAPLIEQTGFRMENVNVDITIPPGISFSFVKQKEIDPADIAKLLEENKDKELLKKMVNALQKADTLQKGMNLAHYSFTGISLRLGLPPDVSIKFNRNNE